MATYHVKCVLSKGDLWTEGGYYMVTDEGLVCDHGMRFNAYMRPFNGGENTVEAINRWFEGNGNHYRFELVTANEKLTEEKTEDIVTLKWTKARCHNVAEFLELYFFDNIRDDEDMDSLWYLHDLIHAIEELKEVGKGFKYGS